MLKAYIATVLLLIFLGSHSSQVFAQTCSPEEESKAVQLLALAEVYEQAADWENAADTYSQVASSTCDSEAIKGIEGLQRSVAAQKSWWQAFQTKLLELSQRTVIGLIQIASFAILLWWVAKLILKRTERPERWSVMPFLDLSGGKWGDPVTEMFINTIHEIRFLHSQPTSGPIHLVESSDLPSFSGIRHREELLLALTGLDTLDLSGFGLPIGSMMSSVTKWLDLGGSRLVGSIRQFGQTLELTVRFEEGRSNKCRMIWKESATEDNTSDSADLLYLLQEKLAYRVLIGIMPGRWETESAEALRAFSEGLEELFRFSSSHSLSKSPLLSARKAFEVAINQDPAFQTALYKLALTELYLGNYDQAIDIFKNLKELKLLADERFRLEIGFNLGIAYYQKTTYWAYDKAEEAFNEVISRFREKPPMTDLETELLALTYCGLVNIAAQRATKKSFNVDQVALFEEGKTFYQEAIRLASDNREVYAQAQYSLGILHLTCGKVPEAQKLLEESLAYNPYHWKAYVALGQVALAEDRYKDAIAILVKATKLSPDYEYAYYQLGRAYQENKEYELALAAFSKAATIASAHNEHGRILAEQNGDYKGALASFLRAIELNSQSADAYANMAWYMAEGKLLDGDGQKQAETRAKEAVRLAKNSSQYWHKLAVLGRVYYDCGRFQEARTVLEEAQQLNNEAAQVSYYLALVEFAQRNYQQARQQLIRLFENKSSSKSKEEWQGKARLLMREIETTLKNDATD